MFKLNKTKIFNRIAWFDIITISAIVFGTLALLSLVYTFARPIKLADIKVPVATDKASYYAGQEVSGIFFGQTYYKGSVRILREVFCSNYKGVIKPPAEAAAGDFFATQATPRKFEGDTLNIGKLPDNVPVGSNCVIQFTNVYDIQTPFGVRHEEVQYYTQNFSIITQERRQQLDSEAAKDNKAQQEQLQSTDGADSSEGGDSGTNTQTNSANSQNSNSNSTSPSNQTPSEPVQPPVTCRVSILGFIKFGCNR